MTEAYFRLFCHSYWRKIGKQQTTRNRLLLEEAIALQIEEQNVH
jgi:hypothetical protein